jgi:hypothetical protein
MVVRRLSQPVGAAIYLAGVIALGIHLTHAFRSALQNPGIQHRALRRSDPPRGHRARAAPDGRLRDLPRAPVRRRARTRPGGARAPEPAGERTELPHRAAAPPAPEESK